MLFSLGRQFYRSILYKAGIVVSSFVFINDTEHISEATIDASGKGEMNKKMHLVAFNFSSPRTLYFVEEPGHFMT